MNFYNVDLLYNSKNIQYDFNIYLEKRMPVVIKQLNLGQCTEKWTMEYLSEKCGDREVKIHVAPNAKMDFLNKNFLYMTVNFKDFVSRIQDPLQNKPMISQDEKYYLRSLGRDPRKDPSNIKTLFPEIESDFIIPTLFHNEKLHSSVLRISSADVQLWTHYDIMDNILVVISGIKRVALFPPQEVDLLYMKGDKSEILDIDNPDYVKYPKFVNASRYICNLEKGDVLFIPALWLHNVHNVESGVAVNTFFRHLDEKYYNRSDVYANHDLDIASSAHAILQRAVRKLSELPEPYKSFYTRMGVRTLEQSLLDK